jgi:hypothetical protein
MTRRLLAPLLLAGCAPDLSDELDPGPPSTLPPGVVLVDATSETEAVGFDLDAGAEVDIASADRDLSFLRYHVRLNGGASGPGTVEAAVIAGVAYDDVVAAPVDGFATDAPDADGDGLDELVFAGWYTYDQTTHTLEPADVVYVVRTTGGAAHKVGFLSYYDEAGTPAMITFRSDVLDEP